MAGAPVLPEAVVAYLTSQHVMTLASGGDDGPWAAPVFYATDEACNFFFISDPASRHVVDGLGPVAGAICAQQDDWRAICGVQLSGQLAIVPAGERPAAETVYLARFPQVAAMMSAPQGSPAAAIGERFARATFYRLTPEYLRYIDNSQGFGHKQEFHFENARADAH